MNTLLVTFLFCLVTWLSWFPLVTVGDYVEEYEDHFTNDFVVQIDGDDLVADLVANSHGFKKIERLDSLEDNLFHFIHETTEHRSKRSAEDILELLERDPNVLFVEQQRVLMREKKATLDHARHMVYDKQSELDTPKYDQEEILARYFGEAGKRSQNPCAGSDHERGMPEFNDQYSCLQWYLVNTGQTKGKRGYDINVLDAWNAGFTGKGVVVSVLDDGLDHKHPEIRDNYDPKASYDLNDLDDRDHDPQPPSASSSTAHGTRCAGEIAGVANNGVCGVGVAYEANIGGVRILDGSVTDKLEAQALSFKRNYVDIYSSSWGPRDDGKTMEGPNSLTKKALKLGAEKGRNGLGNIYAWATGNGGHKDDCNADGYVSSIYTLSIGCINDKGLSTYFSEECCSTMATIFTGGSHEAPGHSGYDKPDISIITADTGMSASGEPNCNLDFEGTSSAAPLAAGGFALVLEANFNLTWRDMQHLVVETARVPNPEEGGWIYNGAGYHVNVKFGFGSIDVSAMVSMAQMWKTVNEHLECEIPADGNNPELVIQGGDRNEQSMMVTEEMCDIIRLEHTLVNVKFNTTYRGDMSFHIISPSGTDSEILSPRPGDSYEGEQEWTFMTVHNWGEKCVGEWTIYIVDKGPDSRTENNKFVLHEWSLTLYGTKGVDPNEGLTKANKPVRATDKKDNEACELPQEKLHEVMSQEQQDYNNLNEAIEKGTTFTRETVEELAHAMLDEKDFKLFERILHEDEEKENNIEGAPDPHHFPNGKPDTSQADSKKDDLFRKRAHLYTGGESNIKENNVNTQRGSFAKSVDIYNRELDTQQDEVTDEEMQETIRLLEELINEFQ